MATKKTVTNTIKYYINIWGKRTEVTKEEYEKRYPPIEVESEETDDSKRITEPNP